MRRGIVCGLPLLNRWEQQEGRYRSASRSWLPHGGALDQFAEFLMGLACPPSLRV